MKDALGSVQSVVLLGGTSDIGLAIVRALSPRQVTLLARDEAAARRELPEARVIAFDAARPGPAIAGAFDGGSDVDVVIVAFGMLGRAGDEQLADAEALHELNGTAAVAAMTEAAEHFKRQGHGTIVLLSSVAADRPRVSNYAYGSSKAAADAFARGLGDALHGTGVDVLVIRPGFVKTSMTAHLDPAPLSVTPEQVASATVDAIRRRRAITYVPTAMGVVSLILRLLPRPLFRRLPF